MPKKKQIREKQCCICAFRFIPRATTQKVCSPGCAIKLNKKKKQKEFDAETRRLKATIKTRADFAEDAQKSVNRYVRLRDIKDPCISCGRFHSGQYHAGHWLSRGAFPELAYCLLNINKQCSPCNLHKGGNQAAYRTRLIQKIGIAKVEWLEGPHKPLKASIDYLVRIKKIFDKKYKRLKANDVSL